MAMSSQADGLGLSSSALPLLADVIHERLGLFYEPARFDLLARPSRPARLRSRLRVVSRLLLPAEVRRPTPATNGAASPTPCRCPRPTSGARSISCARSSSTSCRGWPLDDRATAHLERALRHRRGAADAGDAARGGRLVRARRDRDPRQRRERRRRSAGRAPDGSASASSAPCRRRCARVTSRRTATTWVIDPALHARITSWSVVNLMCEGDDRCRGRARRSSSAATSSFIFRPRRSGAPWRPSPAPCRRAAYLCLGASESLLQVAHRVRARGNRRRLRLREDRGIDA